MPGCSEKGRVEKNDPQEKIQKKIQEKSLFKKGKRLTVLKEVVNATDLEIDGEELFVLDEMVVYVYSLKDYRFLRKFGGKGNGPGEMIYHRASPVQMELFNNNVYLYRMYKLVNFSKEGKLAEEKKFRFLITHFALFGKNYVITKLRLANQYVPGKEKYGKVVVLLFNKDFKKQKEIYLKKFPAQDVEKDGYQIFRPTKKIIVRNSEKYLFIFDSQKGSLILVYDERGIPLEPIFLNLPKISIPKEFTKDVIKWMKSDHYLKVFIDDWNLKILFPQYFPVLRNFTIKNDRIYCQTYIKENRMSKFFIFNFKGELLKKIFLPTSEREMVPFGANKIYDFHNNKYYYLVDNDEDETWELYVTEIK